MKNQTRIQCNGSFIDADWNFFNNREEAISYFDRNCRRVEGAKYLVVDIVYYAYPL